MAMPDRRSQLFDSSVVDRGEAQALGLTDQLRRSRVERMMENACWNRIYERSGHRGGAFSDLERTMRIFHKRDVKTIIDVGGGSGGNAIALARNGFFVVTFDLSPVAVMQAKVAAMEELTAVERKRLYVVQGDMFEPWRLGEVRVDAVVGFRSFYHGTEAEINWMFKHIHDDVLKPDGSLVFTASQNILRAARDENGGLPAGVNDLDKLIEFLDPPVNRTYRAKVGAEVGLTHFHIDSEWVQDNLYPLYDRIFVVDKGNQYLLVDATANGYHHRNGG